MGGKNDLMRREMSNNPRIREYVVAGLENVVGMLVGTSSRPNAVYGVSDLNRGMIRAAVQDASVGGCANGVRVSRESFGIKEGRAVPSDEWFRSILSSVDEKELIQVFATVVSLQLGELNRLGLLPRDGLVIAIDMHLIPRYDRIRGPHLTRSRGKNGTTYFERYITVQCVNAGSRLILGALPVPALESASKMVRGMIDLCDREGVRIKLALLDRGFFSTDIIDTLNDLKVNYLMPCSNTYGVVEALNEFAAGSRESVSENSITNSDGRSAPYTMIITDRKKREKRSADDPKDRYIGFATSMQWVDVAHYALRWGIETGYAKIEAMRAKTRSRNTGARLFCFIYSLMTFNAWIMMRALLGHRSAANRMKCPEITQLVLKSMLQMFAEGICPRPPPSSMPP